MNNSLIECVPNFSEGRNGRIISQIADSIGSVEGVKLLEVDPNADANRTVITFAGTPQAVCEAAFRGIATAAELIDMRQQQGTHPRIGATDVCPLVPLRHIAMPQVVQLARQLAQRVGHELHIPVYCYEEAAFAPERRNLAHIRAGEYEGFAEKIAYFPPDFGPKEFNLRSGATVIGARPFLIAWNCNLNTTDVGVAKAIAAEVRESGRTLRQPNGNTMHLPGRLPHVKAIGWYMAEYGCAQVSTNLTDFTQTPIHIAYQTIAEVAARYGVRVTGSELVGLIPLQALQAAGEYFAQQKGAKRPSGQEAVQWAIEGLGLSALRPFLPKQKVIEYVLESLV